MLDVGARGGHVSAAQIIAQLAAASQKLDEAQAKLLAAREDASQARTLVAGALQGSSGQLVGQIDGLVEVLGQVASRPAATKEQVKQTIAKVQALGN
ncbi:DUF6244 family protein [Micromonospora sp. NPDC005215]|uniref:DUF6244 family protein n=1 Tax=Micromonospora sp. NPDC005215 TaxID=3157024 RepID=UPI0033A7E12A